MANLLDSILGNPTEVYVAVSPSNWVELAVYDPHTNLITNYARASIEYNEAIREITDYDMLKAKVAKLFEECNLQPQKCNVHFSIPTVWFGYKDNLPLLIDDEGVKNIVLGELEQTYIFKRKDPVPFWFDAPVALNADTKSVFYTAIQAEVMDSIRDMFKEMGANLIGIDCSLFADLRGLMTCGLAEVEMNSENTQWNLIIVNNSGFQLLGFKGKKLTDFYEEPLPIKSLDGDEIYSTIDNAAQIALMSSASESLVVLSETDAVSAAQLAKRLQFSGKVTVVEDNKFRKYPLSDISHSLIPDLQPEVSLHLIGMIADAALYPIYLNFLLTIEGYARSDILEIALSKDKVIKLTKPQAMLYSLILAAALLIPLFFGWASISVINQKTESQIEELNSEIANIDTQLKNYQSKGGPGFDPYREIERVLKNNRTKIMAYGALGDSIPKDLYLSYFMTGNDGSIDIQGYANSVEDVYVFFQNLKDYLVESNLRLSKLDLKTSSLEDVIESPSPISKAPYVFEITNMDEGQLSSFMNALRGSDNNGDDNNKGN